MATSRFSPDSSAGRNILDQLNIGRATKKQQDFWTARTPDSVDGHAHGINTPDSDSGRPQLPRGRNQDRLGRRRTTTTTTSTTHSNNATTDDHDHHHHDQHNNSSSSNSASGGGTKNDSGGDSDKETEIHLRNGAGSITDGTYDVRDGDGDHDNHEDHEDHDDHDDHDEHGRQHDHNTDHEGFSCQPTSSQHSDYIQQHLEELQKKCDEFHQCTIELYKAENFHRVLAGEPIQLNNICGLMYPDGKEMYKNGNESVKCALTERAAIRQDIGRRLSTDMAKNRNEWKPLNDCLKRNRTADEPVIDTLCGRMKKEPILCGNDRIHKKAEDFFNHEMEHLHCSCAAIREQKPTEAGFTPRLTLNLRIAVGAGVIGLIVILSIVVIVLCIRHRKVKKRLSQHRMKYLPSPHDEGSAIYQEINDCPPGLRNGKNEGNISGGYHFLGRAPSLPERYVKPQMARTRNNPNSPGEEEREYLEPLPDTGSGRRPSPAARANMGYGAPRDLAVVEPPYDLAKNPANMSPTDGRPPKESDYFERLQPMDSVEDDGGYSTLGRKRVLPEEAHDDEVGAEESADGRQYFVLEPQDDAASEKDALTMVNSDASECSRVQTAL